MKWWNTYHVLRELHHRLKWSQEQLQEFRSQRLVSLVHHVYTHSPFYRRFYQQAGWQAGELRGQEDLQHLPILSKPQLQQANPLDVVTQRKADGSPAECNWMIEATSGSTGIPLKIYRTWNDLYAYKAREIRTFQLTGLRFYHKQVILKSSAESVTGSHWFEKIGILRKYWLSIRDPVELNLRKLEAIKPQHVHAYPSGLLDIAEFLLQQNRVLSLPIICTGAETLDDYARQRIQAALAAEIFDLYGTREVGNIAWECKAHAGLHLNDDMIILELLDENDCEVPVGVEGEVVVTYLSGYDFPFIRYRLGDRAVKTVEPCPCGVKFSRLKYVTGRSDSRLLLPGGRWLSGMVFQELRATPGVKALRIIQENPHSLRLQLVPQSMFSSDQLRLLTERAAQLAQGELEIIPEVLAELDRDPSGKLRMVICRLPEVAGKLGFPEKAVIP